MKPVKYGNVQAQLESIHPLGDYALVKRIHEPDTGLIIKPQVAEGKFAEPPRTGVVIAVGPGDPITKCGACKGKGEVLQSEFERAPCAACNGLGYPAGARHAMHVTPGDRVLYWRAPANNFDLDGEEFTFVHEEQHILAVLDQ